MGRKITRSLSPAQMEIMEILWQLGEVGVADVWKALNRRRPLARNTVQTTMVRLEEKGWLRCRIEGQTYLYSAAEPRQRVLTKVVSKLAETAFGGSASELIAALLQGRRVSSEEAQRIRDLINRAEERPS